MNMCVCNLSMVWDDLMMDVSRKGGKMHERSTQQFWELFTYIKLSSRLGFGLRNKTSCHRVNCISGTTGVRSWTAGIE